MNDAKEKLAAAKWLLNIIWGIFSLILLLVVLYTTWEKEQLQNKQLLFFATNDISSRFDNFIGEIKQSVYRMPLNGLRFQRCTTELIAQIKHLVFNNPQISGLTIKNKNNQVLCTTIAQNELYKTPKTGSATLFGPKRVNHDDKLTFIIQEPIREYLIDIYVLKKIFEQLLKTASPLVSNVALYNKQEKRALIEMHRNSPEDAWKIITPTTSHGMSFYHQRHESLVMHHDLNALDEFQIIVHANPYKMNQLIWQHILIIGLFIVLTLAVIYWILRRFISTHFSLHRVITNAIKNKHFFPVYQPIFDTQKGTSVVGAEILLRWGSEPHEIIMPDAFIEDAEQSGLIIPITLQILETVFQEWQSFILSNKTFHLAINLSAVHFKNGHFFEPFLKLCQTFNIPNQQIMLEITERDLFSKTDLSLTKRMKALRKAGFSLAIDDFGTGHASISYLQHFPFNFLKIDQLFIRAIGTGAITESLNQSIIHLAKNLNLQIIAEGVETLSQLKFLQTHDVFLMQGWYFSKALSKDELISFMNKE